MPRETFYVLQFGTATTGLTYWQQPIEVKDVESPAQLNTYPDRAGPLKTVELFKAESAAESALPGARDWGHGQGRVVRVHRDDDGTIVLD